MQRTFVMGDIHGAFRAVQQLISRIQPEKDDLFIFLGDYVDGWPESSQTVQYLLELSRTNTCIFMRGNHDRWCEGWLLGQPDPQEWLQSGGRATIESYTSLSAEERETHLAFFQSLRNYFIDDQNRLFIHAGFASMHGPAKEHYETNYYWDRSLWEMALAMDERLQPEDPAYPKRLKKFREIYIGHTPTLHYGMAVPMNRKNLWNIDTGAAFSGPVTALEVTTKAYLQSDRVQDLYPGISGRTR